VGWISGEGGVDGEEGGRKRGEEEGMRRGRE